jgi:hypothetical protein
MSWSFNRKALKRNKGQDKNNSTARMAQERPDTQQVIQVVLKTWSRAIANRPEKSNESAGPSFLRDSILL